MTGGTPLLWMVNTCEKSEVSQEVAGKGPSHDLEDPAKTLRDPGEKSLWFHGWKVRMVWCTCSSHPTSSDQSEVPLGNLVKWQAKMRSWTCKSGWFISNTGKRAGTTASKWRASFRLKPAHGFSLGLSLIFVAPIPMFSSWISEIHSFLGLNMEVSWNGGSPIGMAYKENSH